MKTKLYLSLYMSAMFLTAALTGCTPEDMLHGEENKPDAALVNGEDAAHLTITPQCSPSQFSTLVDNSQASAGGPDFPTPYGVVEVANSPTDLYVIVRAGNGWQVAEACFWAGTANSMPLGNTVDPQSFGNWWSNPTAQNAAMMTKTITDWNTPIQLMVHAKLCMADFYGNPANFCDVWAEGTPYLNASKITFVPVSCSPAAPACGIPSVTVANTSTLAEWDCTPGNSNNHKVNVCHVPPGNPANRHTICIDYSALPAHVIDFKPADNRCMGHISGCHIGPCDPCGPGSSEDAIARAAAYAQQYNCH